MLEGRLRLTGDLAVVIDEHDEVLAMGALVAHPGSQAIAGTQIASAVQFSGELTEVGVERVSV